MISKMPMFLQLILCLILISCTGLPVENATENATENVPQVWPFQLNVYTEYEGELNPHEFSTWKILKYRPCPSGGSDLHFQIKNPGPGGPLTVEIIVLFLDAETGVLMAYIYEMNGEEFGYVIPQTGPKKYMRIKAKGISA